MIKNILVPEKIGQYYLFPKRILSLVIEKTRVSACQIYHSGNNTKIEKFLSKAIESGSPATHDQRVSKAIQDVVSQADKYNEIRTTLSSITQSSA